MASSRPPSEEDVLAFAGRPTPSTTAPSSSSRDAPKTLAEHLWRDTNRGWRGQKMQWRAPEDALGSDPPTQGHLRNVLKTRPPEDAVLAAGSEGGTLHRPPPAARKVVADAREGRATPHRRPVSSLVVAPLRRVAKDALARGDHARAAAAAALVLTVTMRARGGDGGGAIASAGQRARARGGSRETKEEHAAAERDAIDVALAVFRATKTEGGETPDFRALQPYSPHARRPPPAPAVRLPPPPRGAVAASGGSRAMTTFTADDEIRLLELKRAASARGTTENEDDVVAVALAYVALKDDPDRAIAELTRRERLAVRRGVRGGDQFVRQDTPARRRAMALCLHAKYVKETKAGRGAADDARLTRAADDARLALVDAFEECPDAVDVASALVKMLEARGDDAIARDVAARCAACAPGDLHAQTRHARLCERARVAALEASLEAEDAERRLRRRSFTTSTMSRSRSKSKSKSKSRTGTPRSRASSGDGSDTSSDSSSSSEEDGGGRGGLFSGSSEDEEDLEEVTAAARKRANDAAAAAPSPDELAAAHLAVLRLDALDVTSLAGLIRARNLGAKKVRDRVVLERVAARVDASIAAAEKVGVGAGAGDDAGAWRAVAIAVAGAAAPFASATETDDVCHELLNGAADGGLPLGTPRDAAAVIHRSGRASSWTRAASTTALMRGRLRGRRLALLDGTRDRGGLSDVEMDALVARAAVAAAAFRSHGFATRACDRVKLEVRMNRDARAREAKDDDLPLARVEANAAAEARDARVLKLAGKIRRLRDSEIARAVQAAGDRTSEPSPDAVVGLALATTRPRDVVDVDEVLARAAERRANVVGDAKKPGRPKKMRKAASDDDDDDDDDATATTKTKKTKKMKTTTTTTTKDPEDAKALAALDAALAERPPTRIEIEAAVNAERRHRAGKTRRGAHPLADAAAVGQAASLLARRNELFARQLDALKRANSREGVRLSWWRVSKMKRLEEWRRATDAIREENAPLRDGWEPRVDWTPRYVADPEAKKRAREESKAAGGAQKKKRKKTSSRETSPETEEGAAAVETRARARARPGSPPRKPPKKRRRCDACKKTSRSSSAKCGTALAPGTCLFLPSPDSPPNKKLKLTTSADRCAACAAAKTLTMHCGTKRAAEGCVALAKRLRAKLLTKPDATVEDVAETRPWNARWVKRCAGCRAAGIAHALCGTNRAAGACARREPPAETRCVACLMHWKGARSRRRCGTKDAPAFCLFQPAFVGAQGAGGGARRRRRESRDRERWGYLDGRTGVA